MTQRRPPSKLSNESLSWLLSARARRCLDAPCSSRVVIHTLPPEPAPLSLTVAPSMSITPSSTSVSASMRTAAPPLA